ncbi:MAG: phage holin family protein [Alloprevotella sp.]
MFFSTDDNVQQLRQLILELRHHLTLQTELLKVDLLARCARLIAAICLGGILFVLATIVLLFLSYAAATCLASLTGSALAAFGLVAVAYLLLALLVYARRRAWIEAPILGLMVRLFLTPAEPEADAPAETRQP